jgi:hypothetical protein
MFRSLITGDKSEQQGLLDATKNLLDECRMVLPGIQALFGFQLVAVVEPPFFKLFSSAERQAHLIALMMTAIAIALVLAPAAYHRQVHPMEVSHRHLRVSTWLLTMGMIPLMLAIIIDLYLVAHAITDNTAAAATITALAACAFVGLWIVLPTIARRRRMHAADTKAKEHIF